MSNARHVSLTRLRRIARTTEAVCGLPSGAILSDTRLHAIAHARQVAMTACRDLTPASLPQIGRVFRRDHTTVLHGIRVARARPDTARLVAEVARAVALSPREATQ